MEFRLLGRLHVSERGRAIPLGGPKQRVVLAHLLLRSNEIVSADRLIDEVWGADPPAAARSTVWGYVSHLRRALGSDRLKGGTGGYVLHADPSEIDAHRFEALVEEARRQMATDQAVAASTYSKALDLWRGPVLEDVSGRSSLTPEITRLEELRLAAMEERIGAELDLGRHAALVPDVTTLVEAHPTRERLWGYLMTALYRSGRQAEALTAYRRARDLLARELGIDPTPDLRRLHEQILRQDGALEIVGAPLRGYRLLEQIGAGPLGVVHRALQPQVGGREVAIKAIHAGFADDPRFIRRFEAEAQLVARLEHPHIVPLYDFWRGPGSAYLVTRYLRGGSLEERLAEGPMAPEEAARLCDHVAAALASAHRQGVIHRDVTPANILFDEDHNAYVSDFGIARDLVVAMAASPGERRGHLTHHLSPEEIRGEPVTPRTDVYGLGLVLLEVLAGCRAFSGSHTAELIEDRLNDTLPSIGSLNARLPTGVGEVIERATATDSDARYGDPAGLAAAFRDALFPAARPVPVPGAEAAHNPYKGLRPFFEADAADFFGRETLVTELVTRLAERGRWSRFLAVVGPSGCGKSSLVRAGLVPALRGSRVPGSDAWFTIEMHPGDNPFQELNAALMRVAVNRAQGFMERLERGDEGLVRAAEEALPQGTELLLVIDQFEEIFTLTSDEDRARFLRLLHTAAVDPESRLRIVVTLRADFYDKPLAYPGLAELVKARSVTVTPLTPVELERAVAGPAERVGVEVDAQLVAEIVADVSVHPSSLPLLQYALTELFDQGSQATLGLDGYRKIGGVSGALARRAKDLYDGLDERGKEAARQLFLRLVVLGEEGDEDTRRRVLRAELTSLEADRALMDMIIDTFGDRRLLAFDRDPVTRGPTVELSHEALLREWERLRGWIEAAREDLRAHRRLASAAMEWAGAGRDPSFLLRGARLARFQDWSATAGIALTGDERAYLEISLAQGQAERAEEEARRTRESQLEKRSIVRLRALVLVLALAVLLASGLSIFAFGQQGEASRQRDLVAERSVLSRARELVLFSNAALNSDPELSLLLALESIELTAVEKGSVLPEAVDAMHWALQGMRVQFPTGPPVAVRAGPDGVRGVFDLPLEELMPFARSRLERELTEGECRRYLELDHCPAPRDLGDLSELSLFAPEAMGQGMAPGESSLAGTQVRVATYFQDAQLAGWNRELERFREATGIDPITVPQPSGVGAPGAEVEADIVLLPRLGDLQPLWRAGALMDIGAYLDMNRIRRDYAPHLVHLTTIGDDGTWPAESGTLVAGWVSLNVKSLIWYPVPAFEPAGYTIPRTWDELIALSDRLLADGRTPWCFGIESGNATGWVATDWVEELVLRTAGLETYDRWVAHEIPFTHPAIKRAVELMGRIALSPGYVAGGGDAIVRTSFWRAQNRMFEDPPACWLHRQASFAPVGFPRGRVAGIDSAAFPFPAMDVDDPPVLLGAGDVFGVFADRPEVREFVRFLVSPDFGRAWARMPEGAYISPNLRFGLDAHGSEVTRAQAEAARRALERDTFRFDASDSMPSEVGSGAFFSGMTEYLWLGPDNLDRVLARIEESWPQQD
ncbi:MAG TPA: extracellular solute-binding protein [Actinomycetota bacterium]